ncbi:hypothetical protein AN911_00335 [Mycobacteroides immunogenum]|uniref:HNH endonuclease n=1 Tax=Mycobacteroides immunogenum TaxID=83262 RepID=A0A7V8LQT5_9MYCO|nr:hypothetical protein AN909_05600 [Mycobacteroides immunogenum]KPG14280.1 hypothetical protein AN908_06805 [Mycobacteroides immunogenum]KPG17445.1 hypothetical protein AN910_04825 [Mycobacteroides immunogenum]KPG23971.1 hypothetical protein AN911_00335 [Mycobacteroides immunogenum]KPG39012.1 hypothetical protein AN914_09890 [Mycobacteroides immunogenum]
MSGNVRQKAGENAAKVDRLYQKARQRAKRKSQICVHCHEAVDLSLKSICRFVDTSGYSVERAREIPFYCGDPGCKGSHSRKPNPWSWSANHKIPVDQLPPDSPLLYDDSNIEAMHLRCNKQVNKYGAESPREKKFRTSRDWFL